MHPYISQVLIAQHIEDALSRAEADRRHAQARMGHRHHHRWLAHWLTKAA